MQAKACGEGSARLNLTMCRPPPREITVNVESVFEEGMVVCYIDSNGTEFRGAMLTQTASEPSLQSAMKPELANPLTFVHDHPYSNMKQYAKHISTKIPPEAMLNWNSFPALVGSSNNENLMAIVAHRKLSDIPLHFDRTVDGSKLSIPQIRSATVVTDPVKEDISSFSRPKNILTTARERLAKKAANSKMFYGKNSFYMYDEYEFSPKKKSFRGKKRRIGSVHIDKHQPSSSTPTFSNTCTMSNPPKLKSKFSLRDFSIPIVRVELPKWSKSPLASSGSSMTAYSPTLSSSVISSDSP